MYFKRCVVGALLLICVYGRCENDNKVYTCINASDWKDAMRSCFEEGGHPMSHSELTNNNDISVKNGSRVWMADFAVDAHASPTGLDSQGTPECMYATVSPTSYVKAESGNTTVASIVITSLLYDNCTEQREYICGDQLGLLYLLMDRKSWKMAKKSCLKNGKSLMKHLSYGFVFIDGLNSSMKEHTVWLDHARTLDLQVASRLSRINNTDIVKYGTFSNCGGFDWIEHFQQPNLTSICVFDNAGDVDNTKTVQSNNQLVLQVIIPTVVMLVTIGIILLCRHAIRHRKAGLPDVFRSQSSTHIDDTGPDVIYANGQIFNLATNNTRSEAIHSPEYELWGSVEMSEGDIDNSYVALNLKSCNSAVDSRLSNVSVTSENAVGDTYDNQDSLGITKTLPVTLHIYDRTNYRQGEPLYEHCCSS